MSKDKSYKQSSEDILVPNKDATKQYPIDILKEIYIKTNFTIERLAQEFQLSIAQVEAFAKTGTENWHKMKAEFQERRLESLSNDFDETLLEKQSIIQRLETLTLMDMAHRMAELEAHYKNWGDFFMRDSDGEIICDGKGQGIRLDLPNSPKELLSLKGIEEAKLTNTTLIQDRLNSIRRRAKEVQEATFDVDALVSGTLDDED